MIDPAERARIVSEAEHRIASALIAEAQCVAHGDRDLATEALALQVEALRGATEIIGRRIARLRGL